jgi:hypothetical protein
MKTTLQYVSDSKGKTTSVQVPLPEWENLLAKLKKYEQSLQIKSSLTEAFKEVAALKKSKTKKQTLKEFLNEL